MPEPSRTAVSSFPTATTPQGLSPAGDAIAAKRPSRTTSLAQNERVSGAESVLSGRLLSRLDPT
ncbi:MAG TPA: hypothetical protein PLD23_16775, partial [Armatimonadota bacterium]|nr:hypothetical protein [Armatimonadota bacterium]